jgi:hypothetical protein
MALLIGPALAVWVKVRLAQPHPSPATNHPKNLAQRAAGWFASHVASPWIIPLFFIVLNIASLLYDIHRYSQQPVTLHVVVSISVSVGLIVLGMVLMVVLDVLRSLSKIFSGFGKSDSRPGFPVDSN